MPRIIRTRCSMGAQTSLPATDIRPKLFEELQRPSYAHTKRSEKNTDPEQDLREARYHAQKLIEEAEAESTYLLEKAQKEAEAARKTACNEGYQEGLARGSREATQQIKKQGESLITFLKNALEEVAALKGRILDDMESEILKLVMMLTEKLVHCELDSHQEAIVGVVKEAIKLVKDKSNIVIKVSPEDYELLGEHRQDLLDAVKGISNLSIDEDESIRTGGCVLETNAEIIDSRLETRLAETARLVTRGG